MSHESQKRDNEVSVVPGQCVTWRCEAPAHGPECATHAAEPLPKYLRATDERLTQLATRT